MSATVLPANSPLRPIEDRLREKLNAVKRTSLGSEYVAFRATRSEVLALAEADLVNAFRRVVLDPVRGLVMLMSPSSKHETITRDIDDLVSIVGELKGFDVQKLGSTLWRRESDPDNTGNEADCSFYFGQKAMGYKKACVRSDAEEDAYVLSVPPDLVVEVGVTHESKGKQLSYRDIGVAEFWQADARTRAQGRRVAVAFLDLQAESGPRKLVRSLNLPGIRPAHVSAVAQFLFEKTLKYSERYDVIRRFLGSEGETSRKQQPDYNIEL